MQRALEQVSQPKPGSLQVPYDKYQQNKNGRMKEIDDLPEFDDDAAIAFILNYIPKELKDKVSEDDVAYILDVIYDFYDANGLIEEGSTEEASIDENDMLQFVMKAIKKDKVVALTEEEAQLLLDGEYEYGKSIGIYDEE